MATLVSPGVAVDVIDESFYIPGRQATVPLVFIATGDEKTQSDGVTPALGTYENNVVRTVTSRSQLAQLYGVPNFLTDAAGNAQHGDARNEYGLDALYKFLEVADTAYVVRANVNLDDSYTTSKALWTSKVSDAGDLLNTLVADYIVEYNESNGLVPASPGYKQSVTAAELKPLVDEAMVDVFASYSFSSTAFEDYFIQDHTINIAGYQDVIYDNTGGNIVGTDITGLNNDSTAYGFQITVVDNGGTNSFVVSIAGQDAQTFAELISEMETAIQGVTGDSGTVVEIVSGRIRITSGLAGATSSVDITGDGSSGTTALFASTNLFSSIPDPVSGKGPAALNVYNDAYTSITSTYDGLDAIIDAWTAGAVVSTEFTASEAEGVLLAAGADFDNTLEFRNEVSLGANDAARRAVIVQQITAAILNADSLVRSERFNYNLVAAPGYWEVTNDLLTLSQDLDNEVFVIGDTPFDRAPTGPNGIVDWQADNKVTNNLVSYFYPHGLTSNVDGATVMSSAASTALRVFAQSDRDSELWYSVAGPTRGSIDWVDTLGYVSGTLGTATTFVQNDIDKGTRDTLFPLDINYFTNDYQHGKMLLTQNTTQSTASALDRINVSRLVAYIRRELRRRLFDFLHEPNDNITRENAQAAADSFLGELVGRRALFDFAVVIEEVENVPNEVTLSQMVVDVAIKAVPAVEFILVDLRIVAQDENIS